jgi:hypothetical protein
MSLLIGKKINTIYGIVTISHILYICKLDKIIYGRESLGYQAPDITHILVADTDIPDEIKRELRIQSLNIIDKTAPLIIETNINTKKGSGVISHILYVAKLEKPQLGRYNDTYPHAYDLPDLYNVLFSEEDIPHNIKAIIYCKPMLLSVLTNGVVVAEEVNAAERTNVAEEVNAAERTNVEGLKTEIIIPKDNSMVLNQQGGKYNIYHHNKIMYMKL